MNDSTQHLYRRLLRYAFQHKGFFAISVLGFLLFSSMEASLVQVLKYFIEFLEGKPSQALLSIPAEVVNSIYFVPCAIVVLSIFRGIGSFLGNFFMGLVGLRVVNTLRKEVFAHMLYLPQDYYDARNSGELVSLIIYNIEQVTGAVTNAVKILLRDGFSVILYLGFLFYISWELTLVFMLVAPILGGIIWWASTYFRKVSKRIQQSVGKITHVAQESFQGIQLVKSYRGEHYENVRFEDAADSNLDHSTKFERVKALQTPILHILIACSLAIIFFLVMKIWDKGVADAVTYVTFAGMTAKPFRQLSTVNSIIQRGVAAAETIFATLDSNQEADAGNKEEPRVHGDISFQNIQFSYDGEKRVLNDVSLDIKAGQTIAFVGASGSGKTTLASLLLRFYQAQSGQILIDGVPIEKFSLESLRNNVALVNQQTILFNDSVSRNIAYGVNQSDIDEAQLEKAASDAYAKHFIDELDSGFDTEVGEDGSSLSGGQRQRIAIARALYKDAPILVLDEATSALDNESEKQIQKALETLKQGRTTLVIAHRLSTIENADIIVVMDQGQIVELGAHRELLTKNGLYASLYHTQSQV